MFGWMVCLRGSRCRSRSRKGCYERVPWLYGPVLPGLRRSSVPLVRSPYDPVIVGHRCLNCGYEGHRCLTDRTSST